MPPAGPESRTDTGRAVYGGGGITPDEFAKPAASKPAENRLIDSIFAFSLELVSGRVAGFENYQVQKPIEYGHDVSAVRFPGDRGPLQGIQALRRRQTGV